MKKTESNSLGKSTTFSEDDACLNDVFQEILPLIFHKLKNRLTPILGYSQILATRINDDFTRERLGKIESNAGELTALFDILKEFIKTEPAALSPANLNTIVRGLEPLLRQMADAGAVELRLDLDAAVPKLPLHAGRIRLLLQNLTANAIQALQAKEAPTKVACISTRRDRDSVTLTVHDNGIGMTAEEMDQAWAPFFSRQPQQAGLGLTFCERIIANHGASRRVSSRPGEFSEFEIRFPIKAPTAPKPSKSVFKNPRSRS